MGNACGALVIGAVGDTTAFPDRRQLGRFLEDVPGEIVRKPWARGRCPETSYMVGGRPHRGECEWRAAR